MRVLIVEDNAFNAFCLTRLLQAVYPQIQVSIVKNSLDALNHLEQFCPSLIILDGCLGAGDGLHCNGPALADAIWSLHPDLPLIAWTNSDVMRSAFAEVFKQHGKPFHENHCWSKVVSLERIQQSLAHLIENQLEPLINNNQFDLYLT